MMTFERFLELLTKPDADPTSDEIDLLRKALCWNGCAAPESNERLGFEYAHHLRRIICERVLSL